MVQRRVGRKEKMTSASSDTVTRKRNSWSTTGDGVGGAGLWGRKLQHFSSACHPETCRFVHVKNFSDGRKNGESQRSRYLQPSNESRGGQSYLFTLVNFSGPSSMFPCDRKEEGSALGNIDLALIHQHIPLLPRHDLHVKQCPLQPPAQSYSDLRKEISFQKRKAKQSARV